jgi:hypothetical protein
MQRDLHYWAPIYLGRKAGIPIGVIRPIAHASQYVDDQTHSNIVLIGDKAFTPVLTSHRPTDYRLAFTRFILDVWATFHFLPGNLDAKEFMARMMCVKNGPLVKLVLEHALQNKTKSFGPHLIGIAAHVLLDSFSHDGYIGLSTDLNKIKNGSLRFEVTSPEIRQHIWEKFGNFMNKTVSNAKNIVVGTVAEIAEIGHAAVYTLPDQPFVSFSYTTENGLLIERNNVDYFLEACECLYAFLIEFAKDTPFWKRPETPASWDSISDEVRSLLQKEGCLEEREKNWKKVISSSRLCPAESVIYSPKAWTATKVPALLKQGIAPKDCHSIQFAEAARLHKWHAFKIMRDENLVLGAT